MTRCTIIVKVLLLFTALTTVSTEECRSKNYGNGGTVCVCTSTECDFISPIEKVDFPNCIVYTSNKAGQRFAKSEASFTTEDRNAWNPIFVEQSRTYQTIVGFGGAFTDAVGINLKSLGEDVQQNLMKSYFGPDSIEYTMGRVPIGTSDFSERLYSYEDSTEPDPTLAQFKIAQEDFDFKIPYLQQAMQLTNNELKLVASAWTSPTWMKLFGSYISMLGAIRGDMYESWANYHVKFLDAYKENNLEFWGITTGNKPAVGFAPVNVPSVAFTAEGLSQWIAFHFGPAIRASNHSTIKILTLDDERSFLPVYVDRMFSDPVTRQYVDGIGVHWHFDTISPPLFLDVTHDRIPDKILIGTQASKNTFPWEPPVLLGSWARGEQYINGMIENFKHWYVGWIDWNLVLNDRGGPTVVNNFHDALIIANITGEEFYKQPMYYAMGHFSKFVTPGSILIDISQFDGLIPTIAFKRPDGGIVVIIVNLREEEVDVVVVDRTKGQQVKLLLSRRSFTTILYW